MAVVRQEQIRLLKWSGHHEVSQSKRAKGPLSWVAIPTKQGLGYCRLVAEHGAKGLGVWVALVQLAAAREKEKRGVIEGGAEEVATLARLCSEDVRSVLGVLSEIGWIALESASNGPAPRGLRDVSESTPPTVESSPPTDVRTDGEDGEAASSSAFLRACRRVWHELTGEWNLTAETRLPEAERRLEAIGMRDGFGPVIATLELWVQSERTQGRRPSIWTFLKTHETCASSFSNATDDLDTWELRRDMGLDS